MSITGNIKTMQLAELLQWLSQSQKTGTLVFDNGQVEKRVFFRDGMIISSASTDPKVPSTIWMTIGSIAAF